MSIVLLIAFGGVFYADTQVKQSVQRLNILGVDAERILNADFAGTTRLRLAASLEADRFVLDYQDYQDTKYALLTEIAKFPKSAKVEAAFAKMVDVQGDIEESEAEAIAFIDEEKWEEALELVTEPSFYRLKGIYRANLSGALREMLIENQQQAEQAGTLARITQFGVLAMFILLALIGVLFSREMQSSLRRQSELALNLEDANKNLEQRVQDRTRELNESQALFKTVLDNMPAVVFLKETDEVVHHAVATISYDPETSKYRFLSHLEDGRSSWARGPSTG